MLAAMPLLSFGRVPEMTTKKQLREISERAHETRQHFGDPRKLKKIERNHGGPLEMAYYRGEWDAEMRHGKRNPYPKGRRHDEYERGYKLADPLAIYYGSGK